MLNAYKLPLQLVTIGLALAVFALWSPVQAMNAGNPQFDFFEGAWMIGTDLAFLGILLLSPLVNFWSNDKPLIGWRAWAMVIVGLALFGTVGWAAIKAFGAGAERAGYQRGPRIAKGFYRYQKIEAPRP